MLLPPLLILITILGLSPQQNIERRLSMQSPVRSRALRRKMSNSGGTPSAYHCFLPCRRLPKSFPHSAPQREAARAHGHAEAGGDGGSEGGKGDIAELGAGAIAATQPPRPPPGGLHDGNRQERMHKSTTLFDKEMVRKMWRSKGEMG